MASDAEAPSKVEIVDDNAPAAEAAAEKAEVAAPAAAAAEATKAAAAAAPKYSKAEKKARKAILKLGLKEIPGVFRVTLKRTPNVSFRTFLLLQNQTKKEETLCLTQQHLCRHSLCFCFLSFVCWSYRSLSSAPRFTRAPPLTPTSSSERFVFPFSHHSTKEKEKRVKDQQDTNTHSPFLLFSFLFVCLAQA